MARKVNVIKVCDMHNTDVDAVSTVTLTVNNTAVELDLCQDDTDRFHQAMEPFLAAGTKVPSSNKARGARRASRASIGDRDTKAIRDWARKNGHEVSGRGRIPADIVEQYDAAM